ncbi:uncharacterized protein LOC111327016 [Stylophora pistillata]|uniref:uncharacterized protein LOC111327016 n=1 Tax=Stylophora pistillata TaxID=50429 RepID=UPI000C0438ED|nr:uncharacterized protein LOC111327016 [Stylophora pistillata]
MGPSTATDDVAMSSPTNEGSDKLRRAFSAVLLQISRDLDKDEQKEFRFYCDGLIPREDKGFLKILRSLEHADLISWADVKFLKEALRAIKRLDLAKLLTTFEVRRDLTILLDFYSRKRLELDLPYVSPSMKTTARHLLTVVTENESERCRFDIARMRTLVESKRNIQEIFEEEVDVRSGLKSSWSKLTMLVIIAGEIIVAAQASRSDEIRRNEMLEQCFSLADKLSSRMLDLGSWDDFCEHVEERCSEVWGQQEECNSSNSVVADVVRQLRESPFFL